MPSHADAGAGYAPIGEGDFPRCVKHKKPLTLRGGWYTDPANGVTRLTRPCWSCPKCGDVAGDVLPPKNEAKR